MSTVVRMHQLGGTDACAKRRNFAFTGELASGKMETHQKRAHLVKEVAISLDHALYDVFKDEKETEEEIAEQHKAAELLLQNAEETLSEGFQELDFKSEKQREIQMKDAMRQIRRFAVCDAKRPHKWNAIKPDKRDVDLGEGILVKGVEPSFIDVLSAPVDEFRDPIAECTIEAVILKSSKPKISQESSLDSLELYALLKYLEKRVTAGHKVWLRASYYYLRKANDSNGSKPNFDEDFFMTIGGRNIVSLEELYYSPKDGEEIVPSEMDKVFSSKVKAYTEGLKEEECTEEDCKNCELFDICKWVNPPAAIKKVPLVRSVSALHFTKTQLDVVNYKSGVLRCSAGPGSGKTLTVSIRVVTLLNDGVRPDEILCITFTNAGAEEMKARIQMYNEDFGMGEDLSEMKILTFNSFGDLVLGAEYEQLGFSAKPKVIDDVERSAIIAKILASHDIEGLDYRNFTTNMKNCKGALAVAKEVFGIVKAGELGVSYGITDADKVYDRLGADKRFISGGVDTVKKLIELYDLYDEKLRTDNLIEYADQEVLLFELLRKDPTYLNSFGIKHIIVDEFQDSSEGQIELVKYLMRSPVFESLMVVGDDSQSIYGFRNTSPEYLIGLSKYLGCSVDDIPLIENFRSQANIVDFANKLNEKNVNKIAKELTATREAMDPVHVTGYHTKEEEQADVVRIVKEHLEKGLKEEDIAIIAYTKYELMEMADLLAKEGIPTVLLNPELLIENSRVRAAIALVNAIEDENDKKDLLTYVNARLGGKIFDTDPEDTEAAMAEVSEELAAARELVGDDKKEMVLDLMTLIDEDEDEVYESFIETLKTKRTFGKIREYCRDFYEYGTQAAYRRLHDYPGVVLTTAHSSKGLEWPVVINMISKYDSSEMATYNRSAVEERRRLLFVSATRARDELYITSQYVAYGKKGDYKYNKFLIDAMDCVGQHFDAGTVETERALRDLEKKQKRLDANHADTEDAKSRIKAKIKKASKGA